MNTMRERFDEKYKESVLKAYSESQESHIILLADIADFIEQEIKKEREEIVKELDSLVSRNFIHGEFKAVDVRSMMYDLINTIKNRV